MTSLMSDGGFVGDRGPELEPSGGRGESKLRGILETKSVGFHNQLEMRLQRWRRQSCLKFVA